MSKRSIRWLIGVVVVAAFGTMLWLATRPPPLTIQGEVSADRVDISPRVAARIVTLKADVGDSVERGAVLAELDSPQLVAARLAAEYGFTDIDGKLPRRRSGTTGPSTSTRFACRTSTAPPGSAASTHC